MLASELIRQGLGQRATSPTSTSIAAYGNNTTGFLFGDEDTSHGETKAGQLRDAVVNLPDRAPGEDMVATLRIVFGNS